MFTSEGLRSVMMVYLVTRELERDDALTTHLSGRVWQTPERLAQTRLGAIPKFQKKGSAILLV